MPHIFLLIQSHALICPYFSSHQEHSHIPGFPKVLPIFLVLSQQEVYTAPSPPPAGSLPSLFQSSVNSLFWPFLVLSAITGLLYIYGSHGHTSQWSTWNMASASEVLNVYFNFNMNKHMWLVAILLGNTDLCHKIQHLTKLFIICCYAFFEFNNSGLYIFLLFNNVLSIKKYAWLYSICRTLKVEWISDTSDLYAVTPQISSALSSILAFYKLPLWIWNLLKRIDTKTY